MKAIVAVNSNWAIGKDGDLLYSIPEDMKFFRETTSGKTVIMGRATLDSLPGGRPLKNRRNIVLSKKPNDTEGAEFYTNIFDAINAMSESEKETAFVIGGDAIYKLFIDYCDEAIVTVINDDKYGDKYFPNLDNKPDWEIASESEQMTHENLIYTRRIYKKINN